MTYAYDPELAPMVEYLPALGIEDPAALNAGLDDTGLLIVNRSIPGPAGAPPQRVRCFRTGPERQSPLHS